MNSLDLLLNRQSNGFLTAPAPTGEVLENILKAGMKAPDHGGITPWHFSIVAEQGLDKLSALFSEIATNVTSDPLKISKAQNMPYRAPMIIVISTKYKAHNKVPKIEQTIAAGCAVHAMQMAAYAQGLGAIWRTGDFSYDGSVKRAFNIAAGDDIIGFLYIGTPSKVLAAKPEKALTDYVSYF